MFRQIGPIEIGLILMVVLIVFGAGKLPQVGSAIGKSIREFRKSTRGEYDDKESDVNSETASSGNKPVNN